MASALIGYSGFVGGTLLAHTSFDHLYRSTNIDEIRGRSYEFLVCAGAPAAKWKANQSPEADLENLRRLMRQLETVEAHNAVLISTVDVYPFPVEVYEDTPIDEANSQPYGRHRFWLEQHFTKRFSRAFVIRLPGLFGPGLRKNFIFDLLRNPGSLHLTHRDSRFQFYDMSMLWDDVQRVLSNGPPLVNIATPPVSAREVAWRCFGVDFDSVNGSGPVCYDMRTRHAGLFDFQGDYIISREEVFDRIDRFVKKEFQIAASSGVPVS